MRLKLLSISLFVLCMHLLVILSMDVSLTHKNDIKKKAPSRLVVNTISLNLETVVEPSLKVQDFESESIVMGAEHSQAVKAAPITIDSGSKDCAFRPASTAVSRLTPLTKKEIETPSQTVVAEKIELKNVAIEEKLELTNTPTEVKKTEVVEKIELKKAATEVKKNVKKKTSQKIKKKEVPKNNEIKAKRQQLLEKAKERIAKIEAPSDKISKQLELKLPKEASFDLKELEGLKGGELSYYEGLAAKLKLLLLLPDYGNVKIKLTLDRTGKVLKLIVIGAESEQNRKYIEKTVPTLTFAPFGSHFTENDHTFTVILSNDL